MKKQAVAWKILGSQEVGYRGVIYVGPCLHFYVYNDMTVNFSSKVFCYQKMKEVAKAYRMKLNIE